MMINPKDYSLIAISLRTAAEQFALDATTAEKGGFPGLAEQFREQETRARDLSDEFGNA